MFKWIWRWFWYYRKDDYVAGWEKRSEWWKEQ